MIFLDVILRAINIKTNTNRLYTVRVEKKLLDSKWKVYLQNGRYGSYSRTRMECFDSLKETQVFVKHVLNKRFKSKSRIGVNYAITKLKRNIFFKDQIKGYSKDVN